MVYPISINLKRILFIIFRVRYAYIIIYSKPSYYVNIIIAMYIQRECRSESVTKQQAVTTSPARRQRGDQHRRNCEKTRLLHNTVEMFERRRCVFFLFFFRRGKRGRPCLLTDHISLSSDIEF